MRKLLALILIALAGIPVVAQFQGENSSPLDRIFLGGGMDLSISNDFLLLGASPALGYMLTNSTAAGVGITYQYMRFPNINETANVFGYRVFLQQMIYRGVFAYAEWERLGYKDWISPTRLYNNRTHVGGGIYQPISDRAGFQAIILYRVSSSRAQDQFNSPLSYRVGITLSPFRRR